MAFSNIKKPTTFLERLVIYLAVYGTLLEPIKRIEDQPVSLPSMTYFPAADVSPAASSSVGSYLQRTMQFVFTMTSQVSFPFGLPLAAAAPVGSQAPRSLFEEYGVDPDGVMELSVVEPLSNRFALLAPQKFLNADRRFPQYLTPAAQRDALPGNCQSWSSLLIVVPDEDFIKLVNDFNKPSPKQLAFIYFLGHVAGARHHKLDPKFDFKQSTKRSIRLTTRQGKTLSAKTPQELGEKMLAELASAEKTIFLGDVPSLEAYLARLPAGIYTINIESVAGHQVTCSISDSREYAIFDTLRPGVLSFDEFLRWMEDKVPAASISLVSYSSALSAHPIEMQRLPTQKDLLLAFQRKDYPSCKEMVAHQPGLRDHPVQLFASAIFYRGSLEDVRFLHEELGIDLNVEEGFHVTPPELTVSGSSVVPRESFGGLVPLQYILIALFTNPEKMPILDYMLERGVNINLIFPSNIGIMHTPLSMAIRIGLSEVAIKLIAKGADLWRADRLDLVQRCLEMLALDPSALDVLKVLVSAGIDLTRPLNANYLNSETPKRWVSPITLFTESAEKYESSQPITAEKFEALADLVHQMQKKRTHPKAETPMRQSMDAQEEKKKSKSSTLTKG